ncbi:MAG: phospholipase [Bacteroidales bacterium]|nr:phospholipase [Bacteroidales bacterium]
MLKYIADKEHYTEVLSLCEGVKHDLWIATADLKDLYVAKGRGVEPFLAVLDRLLHRGVEVRLLHAKEPGERFREDFDRYPGLWSRLERRLCPRVHFKMMIFDCTMAYIGSANLTGAGMGMKSADGRNFEAGILTDDPSLVDAAADHVESVWQGRHCAGCRHKNICGDRLDDNLKR